MGFLRISVALAMLLVATVSSAATISPGGATEFLRYVEEQGAIQNARDAVFTTDADVGTTAFPARGRTIVVDKSGRGNFRTVQAAINSVHNGNTLRITIVIKDGVYKEKIIIVRQKPFIYLKCQSRNTILTYSDTAAAAGGTSLSASTAVESAGFIASDCTFVNSAPAPLGGAVGKQAVALRIQGDQGAFYRVGFLGAQDTLYDKAGRHYFRSCEIVGSIDWIFGDGQSFYHFCKITSIARANSGSITAQNRDSNSRTGFVFFQCTVGGSGEIYLGRAWGTHSRVIFYETTFNNRILPVGWQDWNDPARHKTVYYAEYNCRGVGSNRSGRVKWSLALSTAQARPFSTPDFIDGKKWLGEKL